MLRCAVTTGTSCVANALKLPNAIFTIGHVLTTRDRESATLEGSGVGCLGGSGPTRLAHISHKAVMAKLAENGGIVPDSLRNQSQGIRVNAPRGAASLPQSHGRMP